ncbi:hypothetical protein K7X08_014849 [Anisodus acutangulus]|uniref:PWWP domain-containing protein n=1 Tax=Anisodus acutangulus TaxID=402998 RepID=A0A9Q1LKI0_9SOLA|nr:hypothetical protein K7X08_014849 [Anisodus acutangulus]
MGLGFLEKDSCDLEVVNDLARNEANGVGIDQSGNENETLMQNRSDQGLVGESVVDGVRVFGEGQIGEGLRVQMEGLDVEVDLVDNMDMQEVLGGKNEYVSDGITVNNDSNVIDINGNQDELDETWLIEVVGPNVLVPERRGDNERMEEDGKFSVSDLVWGKVRSHPWWPGQIFEPYATSDKAMKYFKKDCYLIAYFGDQTFAWIEASSIKPFRMYFSQMEKQSNSERFCHAVDCALDEETRGKMKSQIDVNAGIQKESSTRIGGDIFSDETSLNATKLVRTLKSVAAAPHSGFDRLSFVLAKAQLAAFNRWKSYYQLPVIDEFNDLLESDSDVEPLLAKKDASDMASEGNSDVQGTSSSKRPRRSGVDEHLSKKKKSMSILMYGSSSGIPNDQKKSRGRTVQMRKSVSSEKRHLAFDSLPSDLNAKRRKICCYQAVEKLQSQFSSLLTGTPEEGLMGIVRKEFPSPTEMLSKLYSAATDPMNAYSILMSQAGLFCDYRNLTCSETTESGDHAKMTEEHIGKSSFNSASAETLSLEGIADSYGTDRIIQCNPEDQVLFDPEVQIQEDFPNAERENSPNLDNKQEVDGFVGNSERESLSDLVNENSEYSPTALILNFSDLESVPPIADLNIIFSQYGPLYESETELIHKNKRAKLVFKRRDDAENAFSKSGKFSIFGPSLISYRLEYSPSPRKASCTSKRKRKYASSIKVNGVFVTEVR